MPVNLRIKDSQGSLLHETFIMPTKDYTPSDDIYTYHFTSGCKDTYDQFSLIVNNSEFVVFSLPQEINLNAGDTLSFTYTLRVNGLPSDPKPCFQCFDCKGDFEGELHYLCPGCRERQGALLNDCY